MSEFRTMAAAALMMGLAGLSDGPSFERMEREYQPPFRPRSKRQALALEKALRRRARQTGEDHD